MSHPLLISLDRYFPYQGHTQLPCHVWVDFALLGHSNKINKISSNIYYLSSLQQRLSKGLHNQGVTVHYLRAMEEKMEIQASWSGTISITNS